MSEIEQYLYWFTIGCYVFASLFYFYWILAKEFRGRILERVLVIGGVLGNLLLIVYRTWSTGHIPVKNAYELNLLLAIMTVLIFLYTEYKNPAFRLAGVACLPFAFVALGLGSITASDIGPLTPAYKSSWLVVHVIFALIGTACFVFATGTSILYLLKGRIKEKVRSKFTVPSPETLEKMTFKFILVGFFAETVMLISGSIWAKLLWGSFWSWDPVESWSLISWLAYGIYLHLWLSFKFRGIFMAWFCLGCLVINLLSFWFIGLVSPKTYHSLDQIQNPWTVQQEGVR